MAGLVRVAVAFAALLALAACASTTPIAAASSPSPSPAAAPPSAPSSPIVGEAKGFGDTAQNPDTTFICAASAAINGHIIAYLTVGGSSDTAGMSMCNALEQGDWVAVSTIKASDYETLDSSNGCYDTVGPITARIYTATGAQASDTLDLCKGGFGL